MITSAGFRTRLERNSSASGTVMEENPYPSAPFTVAAMSVMARRASIEFRASSCEFQVSSPSLGPSQKIPPPYESREQYTFTWRHRSLFQHGVSRNMNALLAAPPEYLPADWALAVLPANPSLRSG